MKVIFIAATLAGLTLSGCTQTTTSEHASSPICQQKTMPGGWQDVELTPEVNQAVETLMQRMDNGAELKQVNLVRRQIVNGTNYAIEVELKNGEVWHGIVHRNLRNDYLIDSVAKQGYLCR